MEDIGKLARTWLATQRSREPRRHWRRRYLENLPPAVVVMLWPASRFVMGIQVSRSLRRELLQGNTEVSIVGGGSTMGDRCWTRT